MSLPFYKSSPLRYDSARKLEINYDRNHPLDFLLKYPSNFIKTSKYTIITYLPLSLLGQFRRYANVYFLFVAIIQSIPAISPLSPISAIAPLVFVLALSMLREGMEDYQRHKSDDEVNAMSTTVLEKGIMKQTTWADLKVGDVVVMNQDEMFPADLIVLGSEFSSGACYIETSSLDGEKNLKPKSCLSETQLLFNEKQTKYQDKVIIEAQKPTQALYDFDGCVNIPIGGEKYKRYVLSSKQLLLRGAFLRNTKWVLGVVVYTGEDTKIMRNAEPGRIKQSNIELMMNQLTLYILCIQLVCSIVSSILAAWWMNSQGQNHWYFWQHNTLPGFEAFLVFFSYFLLYNTMIPISLIVSLEFVKLFQAYFIEKDREMYVVSRDKYAKANTSTINEELGQVEYIFSDKTGTLTCNQMEFKYCIIGNILYGKDLSENQEIFKGSDKINIANISENAPLNSPKVSSSLKEAEVFQHSIFNFQDPELTGIIEFNVKYHSQANHTVGLIFKSKDGTVTQRFSKQRDIVMEYFFLLSSAHECLVQVDDKTGVASYQGPSPDEITLVDAAKHMGFKYEGGSSSQQEFTICGKPKKIQLLYSFEFDSTRKRMSVIVRDNGLIKLFIKGADNIIKERLRKDNQPFLKFIDEKLSEFSSIGLRTLLMAMKVMSEEEYQQFYNNDLALVGQANREVELIKLIDVLERDLQLIGATAVEDKLQDQVPETIADLLKANIKIWMLTGDKLETAENIARACRLIQADMTVMRFSERDEEELMHKIVDNRMTYDLCIKEKRKKSFLVEGDSLGLIIGHQSMERDFVSMAQHCESVVCCRVTPKQKAQVVKLIKDNLNKITLAIGDGANDCNMIQEAHIGVGLYGNEGMRAVQSSDFAMGEFRCLWRLLLVHGHWSYIRIAEMVLYFFYKNMIFTIPQFFFAFYSAYSGQTFFDDWYITFYNLFFTAVPLIVRATFDQDFNYKTANLLLEKGEKLEFFNKEQQFLKQKFPSLYFMGQKKTIFTFPNFVFWLFQGLIHGLLVFFITLGCVDLGMLSNSAQQTGLSALSILVYTSIIFIVDIKIALYTKFWTWVNFFGLIVLSFLIYLAYFIISNYFVGSYSEDTPIFLLSTPEFYLIIILVNGIIFVIDLAVNQMVREIWVNPADKMIKFKSKMQKMINKVPNIMNKVVEIQLEKREKGVEREWGESFYDEILEEKNINLQDEHEKGSKNIQMVDTYIVQPQILEALVLESPNQSEMNFQPSVGGSKKNGQRQW